MRSLRPGGQVGDWVTLMLRAVIDEGCFITGWGVKRRFRYRQTRSDQAEMEGGTSWLRLTQCWARFPPMILA